MKPEELEWLDNLRETFVKNETVQFFNMDKPVSNKMLLEALQQKMVINYFLATLSQKGDDEYRGFVKTLTMIDIEGWQYIEGKI